jgi:hypothetical protein
MILCLIKEIPVSAVGKVNPRLCQIEKAINP